MSSVLAKTIQSLETALRYNPHNAELMASLAEAYLRSGRFDKETSDLVEKAIRGGARNDLLIQSHQVRLVIEQIDHIENNLIGGAEPPDDEALQIGSRMLDEYLSLSQNCYDAWLAWTRVQLLRGHYDRVEEGIERLRKADDEDMRPLFNNCLQYRLGEAGAEERPHLARVLAMLGDADGELALLEKEYQCGQLELGPKLLTRYTSLYVPERPNAVPEDKRSMFLDIVLNHGEPEFCESWLKAAEGAGWSIAAPLKNHMRQLIDDGRFEEAFETGKRMPLDHVVKSLFNEIAEACEARELYDDAVGVLRYINENELVAEAGSMTDEEELERDAVVSMAEMQMRNGRYDEALRRFVHALVCSGEPDPHLTGRIDHIIENGRINDPAPLVDLARHFREIEEFPKAVFYLNRTLTLFPNDMQSMSELEDLFGMLLERDANLPEIRMELGRLYRKMGRFEDAIDQITIAAASPMIMPRANRMLAEIYFEQGSWADALARYRTLSVTERDTESLYRIYQGLIDANEERDAFAALKLIQTVMPGYRDVATRIEELEPKYEAASNPRPELYIDPKMKELIGDLAIGRYEYVDRLGSGGMGVVHKVFDMRNDKIVAMKILRDSLCSSSKALDRFFREARIAASLHHRNIVEIYDYNISSVSGQSYIAMELVEGPSLRETVDRQFEGGPNVTTEYIAETLWYAVQLCDALQASHEKGIVHRDIKPDNILVTDQGEVKITDFGIVHIEEATFTPTGAMIGTPRYMAPEQVTGGKIDGRADIYSSGILLYETLIGSPPFMTGDISYQQVNAVATDLHEACPVVPGSLSRVVMKCLEKKADNRYQTATQLKLDLLEELDALGGCPKYQRPAGSQTISQDFMELDTPPGSNAPTQLMSNPEGFSGLGLDDELDGPINPSPLNPPSSLGLDHELDFD